jgi:hypothetical protein
VLFRHLFCIKCKQDLVVRAVRCGNGPLEEAAIWTTSWIPEIRDSVWGPFWRPMNPRSTKTSARSETGIAAHVHAGQLTLPVLWTGWATEASGSTPGLVTPSTWWTHLQVSDDTHSAADLSRPSKRRLLREGLLGACSTGSV